MFYLIFLFRKFLFSRFDKVVVERRKFLEVFVNFEYVYSILMFLFVLYNLFVNFRERGERESLKRDIVYIFYFFYIVGLFEGFIVYIFVGIKL